jgi:hypothetical protein
MEGMDPGHKTKSGPRIGAIQKQARAEGAQSLPADGALQVYLAATISAYGAEGALQWP